MEKMFKRYELVDEIMDLATNLIVIRLQQELSPLLRRLEKLEEKTRDYANRVVDKDAWRHSNEARAQWILDNKEKG